jgi:hypothetical protein
MQAERERLSNTSRNMLAMVFGGQAMNTFQSAVGPYRPSPIILQSRSGISTGNISEAAILSTGFQHEAVR